MPGLADEKGIRGEVGDFFIMVRIRERGKVFQNRNVEVDFFSDFPLERIFQGFTIVDESAGKIIISLLRRRASSGQKDAAGGLDDRRYGGGAIVKIDISAFVAADSVFSPPLKTACAAAWQYSKWV